MQLLFLFIDTCSENAFYCVADKKCLAAEWRCDHEKDCPSGEDEAECRKKIII